jgi:hypothetical protein
MIAMRAFRGGISRLIAMMFMVMIGTSPACTSALPITTPTLQAQFPGDQLDLSWTNDGVRWILETTQDLGRPAVWSPLAATNRQFSAPLDSTNSRGFFRLHLPPPRGRISADSFNVMQPIVLPGDIVYASANRDPSPGGPQWNELKFDQATQALASVTNLQVGKTITFSSVDDLQANLPRLAPDINWVSYDSESGMTPTNELANLTNSVPQFAQLAHNLGRKAGWGPTDNILQSNEEIYLALAGVLDNFALQHQKVLADQGTNAFINVTTNRAARIYAANPQCGVLVQVVIGLGNTNDLINGLTAVAPYVTDLSIFTTTNTATAIQIYDAVRGCWP